MDSNNTEKSTSWPWLGQWTWPILSEWHRTDRQTDHSPCLDKGMDGQSARAEIVAQPDSLNPVQDLAFLSVCLPVCSHVHAWPGYPRALDWMAIIIIVLLEEWWFLVVFSFLASYILPSLGWIQRYRHDDERPGRWRYNKQAHWHQDNSLSIKKQTESPSPGLAIIIAIILLAWVKILERIYSFCVCVFTS